MPAVPETVEEESVDQVEEGKSPDLEQTATLSQEARSSAFLPQHLEHVLDDLSLQQKAAIQEVLQRAETSRKEARIVIDSHRLHSFRKNPKLLNEDERSFSVEDVKELDTDSDDENKRQLVQMDSIPESVTVSILETESTSSTPLHETMSPSQIKTSEFNSGIGSRMKLIRSQIAQWFNSLDYDGDYMSLSNNTGSRDKSLSRQESLQPLVMNYINALSSGIVIAATLEYCQAALEGSELFKAYCHDLCETLFHLVYSQIELSSVEDDNIRLINDYCTKLALDVMDTVYYLILNRTLEDINSPIDKLKELSQIHRSRSFATAAELESIIERLSSEDIEDQDSLYSSPSISSLQCYEVLPDITVPPTVTDFENSAVSEYSGSEDYFQTDRFNSAPSLILIEQWSEEQSFLEQEKHYNAIIPTESDVRVIISPATPLTPPPRPPPPIYIKNVEESEQKNNKSSATSAADLDRTFDDYEVPDHQAKHDVSRSIDGCSG
ncbi:unnamed protein product [Auanema sp. JU1783]|nr:unnamed protein product [Auanema sp. JU1783]